MEQEIFDTAKILAAAIVRLSRREKTCRTTPQVKARSVVSASCKKYDSKLTHDRREITHDNR